MAGAEQSKALAALREAVMPLLSDKALAPVAIRVLTELADSPAERVAVTPGLSESTGQLLAKLAGRQELSDRRKTIVDAWTKARRVLK